MEVNAKTMNTAIANIVIKRLYNKKYIRKKRNKMREREREIKKRTGDIVLFRTGF